MKILFNDGKGNIITNTNNKNLLFVDSGTEGIVYKYNDLAIKIYHDYIPKDFIGYPEVKKFFNIDTKRILLPKKCVYQLLNDNHKAYMGYLTQYIDNRKSFKNLVNMDSNKLDSELSIINDDIITISKNKIRTFDNSETTNIIYNGEIYFIDPGSYKFCNLNTYKTILNSNIEQFNFSLYKNLFLLKEKNEYLKYEISKIYDIEEDKIDILTLILIKNIYSADYYLNFDNNGNYINYLKNILDKYESLLNYKRKIIEMEISKDDRQYEHVKKLIK